ncbi:hypothetical protein HDU96_003895 [Phlyctochytrium bullatum]|nr:hypothetical protein HDU96_003895 [Phlyctochytrium bullatum]
MDEDLDDRDRGPQIDDYDDNLAPIKRPSNYDEHGEEVFLDTKRLKTNIWLVKVPEFLMQEWSKIDTEGVELGRLRVYSAAPPRPSGLPNQQRAPPKQKVTLHLPESKWSKDLPKDYILDVLPPASASQNTFVFCEDDEGRARELAGKVVHEAAMRPFTDERYREIMKKRREEALKTRKNITVMHHKDGKKVMHVGNANAPSRGTAQGEFLLTQKKTSADKRERIPKEELIGQIFEAFQASQYYSFKELLDRLKQPQQYLKEVIGEVCVLVKKGEEHGKYQLKPEYQTAGATTTADADDATAMDEDLDDDDDIIDDD